MKDHFLDLLQVKLAVTLIHTNVLMTALQIKLSMTLIHINVPITNNS